MLKKKTQSQQKMKLNLYITYTLFISGSLNYRNLTLRQNAIRCICNTVQCHVISRSFQNFRLSCLEKKKVLDKKKSE